MRTVSIPRLATCHRHFLHLKSGMAMMVSISNGSDQNLKWIPSLGKGWVLPFERITCNAHYSYQVFITLCCSMLSKIMANENKPVLFVSAHYTKTEPDFSVFGFFLPDGFQKITFPAYTASLIFYHRKTSESLASYIYIIYI